MAISYASWRVRGRGSRTIGSQKTSSICAGPFGTIFKARDFRPVGVPIIFPRHVTEKGYSSAKPGFTDEAVWKKFHQEYTVHGGELLVTRLGDPPGTACIYPESIGPAMVTPDVLKMSVDEHVANSKYLMYFFSSPSSKRILRSLAFGMIRLRIDIAMFKQFPIPTPCLEEQDEIVRRVDGLCAVADQIENAFTMARESVSGLPFAALAKAFVGKPVPSDPSDEAAHGLLSRCVRNQNIVCKTTNEAALTFLRKEFAGEAGETTSGEHD